ncbi:MAG: hypothetical protein RL149_839 [Actinomycetota bacterium]|jgi:hypothetical protein
MSKIGGFFVRYAAALVSSTIAFVPFYIYALTSFNRTPAYAIASALVNSLDTFAACELFMAIVILLVAYPVERFINAEKYSSFRNASTYLFLGSAIFAVLLVATLITPPRDNNFTLVIAIYVVAISTITAFIARFIYAFLIKQKRAVIVLSACILALAIAGPAIPTMTNTSPPADNFYPATFDGEVARGSWDVNELDGSAATNQNDVGAYDPNKSYEISFRCKLANASKFRVHIRERDNLVSLSEFVMACNTVDVQTRAVALSTTATALRVLLEPLDGSNTNGVNSHPDAWAALAPKP